jgi:SAM-dependent methyltransferase
LSRPLYDELVPYYEILEGRDWQAEIDLVSALLERYHCRSVVDLGCGTGRHVRELARRGFDALGIDLSGQNIRYARNRAHRECTGGRFVVGSYYDYRPRIRFDAALCLNWSIPVDDGEIERFLMNTSTLLKEGGILIFDYEKSSQIAWDVVGTPVVESWKLDNELIVRASVGGITNNVLGSTDVYLIFRRMDNVESPNEDTRYRSISSTRQPKTFVDNSFVRFFSPLEIRKFAQRSGFREILNRVLPRGRYRRNYAVLKKDTSS